MPDGPLPRLTWDEKGRTAHCQGQVGVFEWLVIQILRWNKPTVSICFAYIFLMAALHPLQRYMIKAMMVACHEISPTLVAISWLYNGYNIGA